MDIDVIVKTMTQFEQRITALEQMFSSAATDSPTQPDIIPDILSRLTNIEGAVASLAAAAPQKAS